MDISFSDLLHRAEQLTADMETGSELPRIERNFPQLAEASNRLLSKTWGNVDEASDVKASLLLSSRGVELPKLSQRLESLDATKTFEPIEPILETDIQSFLKNERENAILATIEETKRKTFENAEKKFWNSLEDEWEREKQKILNSLLTAGKESMVFPLESNRFEEFILTKGRSSLTAIEMSFARQLFVCNEMTIQKQKGGFLDAFKQVGQKCEDQNAKNIWILLEQLLNDIPLNEQNVRKLRQSNVFQNILVKSSKKFLEDRYRVFIEKCVFDNLQQACLGGVPGLYNLVLSFLKIKLSSNLSGFEDGTINGVPVWPLVYFCLRCGDVKATEQAAEALPPQYSDFKASLKEFLSSPDNRLHTNNEAKLRLQYKRSIRSSSDPFKRILFCIVGQCDNTDSHSEVIKKTEDYLWLKLNQVQFEDPLQNQETVTLQYLQKLLLEEYGETHFKAYDQPYLYCQVLFLTGQFEAGIEFLSRIDHCRCHAVHLAIVLQSYNLLLMPDLIHTQLLSVDPLDPPPLKRLNFARLITIYTRKFETTDPREALEYFFLLRGLTGPNGQNLFASCISELALETREFETILGCIKADGTKKPGCISKFKVDVSNIVCTVAKDAESKGQFEDATMLYDLADNHEKVLELLTTLLSQLVPLANSPQSSRERIQILARSVAERYKTHGHNGSRTRSSTFYLLIDLMYFFDLYHEQQFDTALDTIQKIKLIPLKPDEVEQKVTSFKQYSDEVRQCLPDVLLATMSILYGKYKKCKLGQANIISISKEKEDTYLKSIRNEARSLVTFAGLLPYRMPGDSNARLVQMEIMMN
ncbi:nuclear pore complex protein Nup93 [Hydra vulgaris]|uniref:Nuclear pore protein n=1 Tax=Hydra vulgaris TaxID=6087 RepID=T2MA60_HYDVU|nr:nuclear pore complex protein Nup93 [Hydra vulgaris]